jgi:hypothetical protein
VGGGKGSNTTKSTFKLPPEFIKAYSESLGLAREAIQKPYTPYTGQLVAGLTPGQQQGISNIQSAQGMAQPFIQEGAGLTREAARGITPELYDRFYSPYVRDVANATQANLLESGAQQRSGLKGGAIQAGAFGGDRSGIAQAEMSRQQQLANAQAMSNIYNQGYGQAMGLANNQVQNLGAMGSQLAGMGTTAQTSALQGAQAQLAAGAQEQTTNQAGLQAAYDQFLQQQSYPFQIAQYFANIAQGLGSTAGGTSATTAPGPSAASQIMGGIGALGSIASMASDERVKENIEAVGTLNDGQTVYRYNFKGDPKTQIGLLAQEVEQRNPGAVSEVKGLKMVDYRDATEDAASSMGGVVGPDSDRQGFMNGGTPYGGVGFVPNNPMQTGATSKIPDAVATQPDAGLAGSAATADPFSDQQKKGFANIGNMFAKPSVYNSGGVVGRNAYAEGGVPFIPYSGGSSFIPEGKIGGGGSAIPSEPDAYVDKGLAEDWQSIKPFTEEQQAGLEAISGKVRGMFADPDMAAAGYTGGPSVYEMGNPQFDTTAMPTDFNYKFASGGVAGRNGYQFGGAPTMEDAMAEAEAMRETQGLGGGEYPRLLNKESGNNYGARNKQGYVGRGQFGDARLEDARRSGVLPEGMDKEAFRRDPNTQQAVEKWHFSDINDFIDKRGLGAFEGKTVGGVPVTREGLVNVAHLGGKSGMKKFITSGGVYNPTDANGTRLSDYLAMGAQSGGVGAAPAPAGYSDDQIVPTAAEGAPEGVAAAEKTEGPFSFKNLFASETNPSIIESIIGRRMSPEARNAVLNASFALMAGRSPYLMTNLGEAGKVGTQTYYNAIQQKQARAKEAAELAQQQYGDQTTRMIAETNRDKVIREQEQEAIRQNMIEEAISTLPPDQQAAARLAPEEFFKAQAESMFGTTDAPAVVQEYLTAKEEGFPGTLADWKALGTKDTRSFAPIPYARPDGTIGYGIPRDDGTFVDIQSPEGAEFLSPFEKARQSSSGAAEGKITTEQALSAASDIQAANQALSVLDQIITNSALESGTGFSSLANIIPGTPGYDFQNLVNQAKSGAFLTAIEQLRGLGALSNTEGQAATSAITRMDTATSKEAFLKAVSDYRSIIETGKQRAAERIQSSNAAPRAQNSGPEYIYNPKTGKLE